MTSISVDLDIGGLAPLWATGPGAPKDKPVFELGAFAERVRRSCPCRRHALQRQLRPQDPLAVPRRCLATCRPCTSWSVSNKPDYGPSLAPQGTAGTCHNLTQPVDVPPNLLDPAWTALHRPTTPTTRCCSARFAPRGYPNSENRSCPLGFFNGMKPLRWAASAVRFDERYQHTARRGGRDPRLPTEQSRGSPRVPQHSPRSVQRNQIADHPYSRWYPPNVEVQSDPDYSTLARRSHSSSARSTGSSASTAPASVSRSRTPGLGYIADHPKRTEPQGQSLGIDEHRWYYLNWAEYISWRDPRIQSTMQYLLGDPLPATLSNDYGGFASGLIAFNGTPKPTYDAYRLPLYLPVTATTERR